jgi:integrase
MGTIPSHLHFTREFLRECFIGDTIDLSQLRAQDVIGYVMRHAQTLGRSQTKKMTIVLRSFLRFLRYRGDLATDLAASVPSVACWSLSEVPKYLEPIQVQSILDHCDQKTATGLRDYAILLLLARLGLRAGEVAFLMLEDIDWEAGQITVHGKGGRSALFPLPIDVGEAVSAYLKNGRPSCSSRSVFVTGRAPRLGLPGSGNISSIAKRALARAGIDSHHKGAHRLRQAGVDLSTIALWLGHESIETTQIYLDADLALKEKALAKMVPINGKAGRYTPSDSLLEFLKSL